MLDERHDPIQQEALRAVGGGAVRRVVAGEDAFVGRDEELARLRAAVEDSARGAGSLFLVSGEPGIGKTRLALELSSDVRARGGRVAWGRCWEAGGAPPYWPWIDVLRVALTFSRVPLDDAFGRHAKQLARIVPEALAGVEPAAAPADPESGRFLLFDAVAAALRRAAVGGPLLVVVDDFHAADRASVLLLAFLARALRDCGVVLLGTYRDAEAGSSPDLVDALGELSRSASRIALGGLDAEGVRAILEATHAAQPASALVERIHHVTDGNPFFVREIARLLPQAGARDAVDATLGIPEGIRETVRRRLQPLAAPVRSLLAVAAVAGREFDAVVVAGAARREIIDVLDLLAPAPTQGIVDAVPGQSGRFSFRHALIQETLYDDLPLADRVRRHQDVRDALERLWATAPHRYVAALAHHALAAAPACDDERFVEHGVRAARVAMQRMAFEEAVRLYERTIDALVHAGPDDRRRCELLLALAEAKEWANDPRGSRAVVEQAAEIARRLAAPDLLARAALTVGAIEALKATASSRCETAAGLLVEALALTGPSDRAIHARLRSRLALHYLYTDEKPLALVESATAVTDARTCNDTATLAQALISRHSVVYGPDHLEERCAIANELLRLAQSSQSREFAMRAHALRVVNALELGDMVTVEEATAEHDRLAAETLDPFERWASLMLRCARAMLTGHFDEASTLANEGLALTNALPGPHAFETNGPAAYPGQILLIEDTRFGKPLDPALFDAARARFHAILAWRAARLHALTRRGNRSEVRAETDSLMDRGLPDSDRSGTWLGAISILAEAVAFLEDRHHAAALYPKLLPYAHHNVTVSFVACRGSASRFLGLLAATMGNRAQAVRHFADALVMNRRMGALPHVAATLYDHAAILVRGTPSSSEVRHAGELCREALAIARELGMEGLEARCGDLLAACPSLIGPDDALPREEFALFNRGAFWVLSNDGREIVVKHRKGLHYVAELLRNPDRDIHTRDLVALLADSTPATPSRGAPARLVEGVHTGDFSEPLVDPKARRAYRRRLDELEEQLDAAGGTRDPEELVVLREEHAALEREMARVTGLGGRLRRIDDAERIRVAVTRAIRGALAAIATASPEIGGTLARRIRTGNSCRYSSSDPPH